MSVSPFFARWYFGSSFDWIEGVGLFRVPGNDPNWLGFTDFLDDIKDLLESSTECG